MHPDEGTRRSLWGDSFGRVAVRSAQVLLVLALVACVVLALRQLTLVVVPVLIATVLAAAISPVVRLLRAWGWPPALATWTAMLAGLAGLGVVLWLVGRGIRNGWDELARSAGEDTAIISFVVYPVTHSVGGSGRWCAGKPRYTT